MAIGILHLSDIHLTGANDSAITRAAQIRLAVQGVCHDVSDILLVTTGDVGFSGKQREYEVAQTFFKRVVEDLRALPKVNFIGTVLIPGNHDCDFEKEGDDRQVLLSSIGIRIDSVDLAGSSVEQILRVQDAFFSFEESLCGNIASRNRLFWSREFDSGAGRLSVRCLNTAWMSRKKELPAQLYFPIHAQGYLSKETDLVFTLMHHPYGWLEPMNARALRAAIESSDVVLTGHEHDSGSYQKIGGTAFTTTYVEGAALQRKGIETGFNYLKIDPQAQTYQVHEFKWSDDMYTAKSVNSAVFTRNQSLLEHRFMNNSEFKKRLTEIGAPLSHPVKPQVSLRDIFIYPDLRITKHWLNSDGAERVTHSGDVLEYIFTQKVLMIAGPPSSGKTSLAKVLYEDLQTKKKIVPVMLQYEDLRGVSANQVLNSIRRAFEEQYSPRLWERFCQLDRGSKGVIVDDWHRLKFNSKGRAAIQKVLEDMFAQVIMFADDTSILQQIADGQDLENFRRFQYCEIKQFGYRLRGEVVSRWHTLGREYEIDEMELTQRVAESENLLDTLIGKSIVPSYPLFICSVLQAAEAAVGQEVSYGSYGHIYQSLLTSRMARVNAKNLGGKFTYLSLIAYHMFACKRSCVTSDELKDLHQKYEQDYVTSVDQHTMLEELVRAQVLVEFGEEIRFQYKYAYYFFVAKYFHDAMADGRASEEISKILRDVADAAHDDDNAHILIFYLYLTKDRTLIEHILANAQKVFADQGTCDFEEDVAFINAVDSVHPTLVAPPDDIAKNREEFRQKRDEFSEEMEQSDTQRSDTNQPGPHMALAFWSLQIMGQVLRNFPTDLLGDLKLRLARESYQVGLRTLRTFLTAIEANVENMREEIMRHLKKHQSYLHRDEGEARKAANRTVAGLAQFCIYGTIKRISFSVGLEDLKETYDAVRKMFGEGHMPTRLIDLSIKLDHFGKIPERDAIDLENRLRTNTAIYTILRILIAEHLYLFPCNFKVKQRIGARGRKKG